MNVLVEGHTYELPNFENTNSPGQILQFIHKEHQGNGELKTINDGTTTEEVIKVLINRLNSLQAKFPCRENAISITKLDEALLWLNKRTEDRKARNVEGKHIA
ncbi:MAG: hypothetical protein RLZZ175_2790 [Bacteroidota bacterium]|jgi:hypothetical protein